MKPIAFVDLQAQQQRIREKIETRINAVLDHGQYIMGAEVQELEQALAAHAQCRHVISCSSGTDALMLGLLAYDVKPGDGVIVPSFTFAATAEVLPCMGAVPIFADIDPDTFNLDANKLDAALLAAKNAGIPVVGIISVGLFGQPADMTAINNWAGQKGVWVMDDGAQSFGGGWQDAPVGSLAPITTTSFFPAKPLGCYGDGGAVFTDDDDYAALMRSIRFHGMGAERYIHERIGMTARLDTIQAAVLLEKLAIFPEELDARQSIAASYTERLGNAVQTPFVHPDAKSSWAQYCIKLPTGINRDALQKTLLEKGIPTAVYYPMGMHQQGPYEDFPIAVDGLPNTDDCCGRTLALPFHPYLDEKTQAFIIESLLSSIK